MHRRLLPLLTIAVATTVGCSHDGRALRPPRPGQTLSVITTTAPPVTAGVGAPPTGGASLTLVLPFADGGTIDAKFTCRAPGGGTGVSPGVSWAGVPAGTKELALVVTDPDAGGFVHWVLTGIDPNASTDVPEGAVPAGLRQARNGFGSLGWGGPCPASGVHHYRFTLHALSDASGVSDAMAAADAVTLVEGHSIASTSIVATFGS